MRKRTLGVVLLTGLAMSGAGAFTATNTMSQTSNVAGYGQATATGATVTDIAYSSVSTDASKVDSVTWTTSTDVTGKIAKMVLKLGTTVKGSYSCTLGTWDAINSKMTIACDVTDNLEYVAFDATGLTVTD
jgi:uncharacterized spore protein YtfJ